MTDRQLAQIAARVDAARASGIWTGESVHDIVPLFEEVVRLRAERDVATQAPLPGFGSTEPAA